MEMAQICAKVPATTPRVGVVPGRSWGHPYVVGLLEPQDGGNGFRRAPDLDIRGSVLQGVVAAILQRVHESHDQHVHVLRPHAGGLSYQNLELSHTCSRAGQTSNIHRRKSSGGSPFSTEQMIDRKIAMSSAFLSRYMLMHLAADIMFCWGATSQRGKPSWEEGDVASSGASPISKSTPSTQGSSRASSAIAADEDRTRYCSIGNGPMFDPLKK